MSNKNKAVAINENLRLSSALLKDLRGFCKMMKPVSPAPVAAPAEAVAEPAEPVAETVAEPVAETVAEPVAETVAETVAEVAETIASAVKVIAGAMSISYEASCLTETDIRELSLRRMAQSEMLTGFVAGEIGEIWAAARPTVLKAAAWTAEQALAEERTEAARGAELEGLQHARELARLKREMEAERIAAEHEADVSRLTRAIELCELKARLAKVKEA
jgi:hypothetical protein